MMPMKEEFGVEQERKPRWTGLFAFTRADVAVWGRLFLPVLFLFMLGFGMGFMDGLLGTENSSALLARQFVFGLTVVGLALTAGWATWRWWSLMDEMERKIEGIVHVAACVVFSVIAFSLYHMHAIFGVSIHEDAPLIGALLIYLLIRAIVRWRLRAI